MHEDIKNLSPEERVAHMKGLLRVIVLGGSHYDTDTLGDFIEVYDYHQQLDREPGDLATTPDQRFEALCKELEIPEAKFEFSEETYDGLVRRYDSLGGKPRHQED